MGGLVGKPRGMAKRPPKTSTVSRGDYSLVVPTRKGGPPFHEWWMMAVDAAFGIEPKALCWPYVEEGRDAYLCGTTPKAFAHCVVSQFRAEPVKVAGPITTTVTHGRDHSLGIPTAPWVGKQLKTMTTDELRAERRHLEDAWHSGDELAAARDRSPALGRELHDRTKLRVQLPPLQTTAGAKACRPMPAFSGLNMDLSSQAKFQKELVELVNRFGLDNKLNTPDFIIGEYLFRAYASLAVALREREHYASGKIDG